MTTKPKLILLPGIDGTGLLFKPLVDELVEVDCTVIAYPDDEVLSFDGLTDRVWSQINHIPDAIVLGESYGGQIALRLIERHPTHFRGVIFCATFGEPPLPLLLWLSRHIPITWSFRMLRPRWILRWFTYGFKADDALLDYHQEATRRPAPRVMADRVRNIARLKPLELVIDLPALYLQATRDRLVPKRCVAYFKRVCAKLEIAQFDTAHLILQTKPKECKPTILSYFHNLNSSPDKASMI